MAEQAAHWLLKEVRSSYFYMEFKQILGSTVLGTACYEVGRSSVGL